MDIRFVHLICGCACSGKEVVATCILNGLLLDKSSSKFPGYFHSLSFEMATCHLAQGPATQLSALPYLFLSLSYLLL